MDTLNDSTLRLLRQQVIADPDDDTVRLVFADRLSELGEEEWAEFVRLQVELGKGSIGNIGSVGLNYGSVEPQDPNNQKEVESALCNNTIQECRLLWNRMRNIFDSQDGDTIRQKWGVGDWFRHTVEPHIHRSNG